MAKKTCYIISKGGKYKAFKNWFDAEEFRDSLPGQKLAKGFETKYEMESFIKEKGLEPFSQKKERNLAPSHEGESVPISNVFSQLAKLHRERAQSLNKDIEDRKIALCYDKLASIFFNNQPKG